MKNKQKAYLVFDVSGSIGKKELQRYREIYEYYSKDHQCTCIAHTTVGKIVKFEDLKGESGGTYISSGVAIAAVEVLKTMQKCKIVIIGDGDNWFEDNDILYSMLNNLHTLGVDFVYHEVNPSTFCTTMSLRFKDHLIFDIPTYIIKNDNYDIFGQKIKPKDVAIKIYLVEHQAGGKQYTFISDLEDIKINDIVLCHTSMGRSYGRVVDISSDLVPENIMNTKYKKIIKVIANGEVK